MIANNELRIGNYIAVDDRAKRVTMVGNETVTISEGEATGEETEEQYAYQAVQPVPLTDDILRQCGFVFHDYFHFWQLISTEEENRSELDIDLSYDIIDFMRRPIIRKVNSLHQLQNIFFVLKGRELNYRETADQKLSSQLQHQ